MLKVLYLLCTVLVLHTSALQCIDENNKPVDWYVAYKLPEIRHHHNKLLKEGLAYMYMTSEDCVSWKFSNKSINATDSIIANTLQGLYNKEQNVSYILYNDQPPNRGAGSKGHNKGVIMINDTNGFWLVHSVPHFPTIQQTYIFPRTGTVYGQSFLCISLDLENLNKAGIQLQYNNPQIYAKNLSTNLNTSVPELVKAASNMTINTAPWYHIINMISNEGVQFISFAKSKQFNKDLYEDLVAPSLETDLSVETWPNGPGRLSSNCSKQFKVNNIKSLYMASANVSFTTTDDHSKWAVSASSSQSKNWICIGDINREEHQKVRGGGTVCLENNKVAGNYKKSIQTIEYCKT